MVTDKFVKALRSSVDKYWLLDLKTTADRLALLVGSFVLTVVVVRIFTTNLHYDAAYTYLHYAYRDLGSFLQIDIANNHPLNSLLVYLFAFLFPYNDFAIRVPALLTAIVYVLLSLNIAKAFRMRWFALALLFGNYIVIEHLGYARGYVLAVTLVLAAMFVHLHRDRFKEPMWTIGYFSLFAVSAYIPSALILVCMMAYDFVVNPKSFLYQIWHRWLDSLIFLIVLGYFAYVAHRISSDEGKEVFGGAPDTFWESFVGGFVSQLFPQISNPATLILQALTLGMVIATAFLARKSMRHAWVGMSYVFVLLVFLIRAQIFGQLVPIERLLVPFWPLWALSIVMIVDGLMTVRPLHVIRSGVDLILGLVLMLNLAWQVQWTPDHHFEKWLLEDYPPASEIDSTNALVDYYLRKDQLHCIRLDILMSDTPDYTLERGDSISMYVFREKRVVVTSTEPDLVNVILLHAYPRDANDLPENLIQGGFINLDAQPYAMYRSPERLIKVHHVQEIDWDYLLIGQFNDSGRLWTEVVREI